MKKHISLFLVAAMLLLTFTACTQPEVPGVIEPVSTSQLNGILLAEFSIVYADESYGYNQRAAQYIQTEIKTRTGLELPVLKDSDAPVSSNEIVIGNTTREISSRLEPVYGTTQFNILAEDTQIAMEGEYFVIAAAAYFFVDTYIPQNNYNAEIPKTVTTHSPIVETATNYIMLIGDGMGYNQTLLFNHLNNNSEYDHGENTFFGYYLPYAGSSRTDSLSGITDSAAGGTALACGIKTYNEYIGQDQNHNPIQSITELASTLGKATAVMSTEANTGATPASFSAHATDRDSSGVISASQAETKKQYGTIIECGYDYYNLNGVTKICDKVTNTLNTLGADPDGFFLMYEEAHIDKHNHKNDINSAFNAVLRFNRVIAAVMEWAFYHPGTMVLITADHESGGLTDDFRYTSEDHTGVDVPVFAYGMGAELFNGITVENIQIPMTIASLMGVADFGDQSTFKPLNNK